MSRVDEIRARLQAALAPEQVEIADESRLHAGHAGARPSGETHFRALVVSSRFAGRGRIERQRMVYAALGDLMQGKIHALAMQTLTPEEWQREGGGA
jgi:BolA family transcriptional regulator, general stress-responsive regulator